MKLAYFQKQLRILQEGTQKFAAENPQAAKRLHLKEWKDKDPYVERLLEGVAFLTGQIEEQMARDLPEVSETLLQQVCPDLLQPLPSLTLMQFSPAPFHRAMSHFPKGTLIEGQAEKVRFPFQLTRDLYAYPIALQKVEWAPLMRGGTRLSFHLEYQGEMEGLTVDHFSLLLQMQTHEALELLYAFGEKKLHSYLKFDNEFPVALRVLQESDMKLLRPSSVFQYDSFSLWQEFSTFPEQHYFLYWDSFTLPKSVLEKKYFTLVLETSLSLSRHFFLDKSHFLTSCAPAINLCEKAADPIPCDFAVIDQPLILPEGYEPYEISSVTALSDTDRIFVEDYHRLSWLEAKPYYHYRRQQYDKQNDTWFVGVGGLAPAYKALSIEVLSHQGDKPRQHLSIGDIVSDPKKFPMGTLSNISRPSRLFLSLRNEYYWLLIQALSLRYQALETAEDLKKILVLFSLSNESEWKNNIDGIICAKKLPIQKVKRGIMRLGIQWSLQLEDKAFSSIFEAYVFARLLFMFLKTYLDINTYLELHVSFVISDETWCWNS
jgi:type VI secretion system protein ImpG